jgi:predicted ATPase
VAGAIRTPDQRLRVFISSTLGELADEREAARASVEQLRLTPVMFELGARPHPPRALYRSYLEQSDVFVGVYWQRYGWVAPDMEISGLEDEILLSGGMPRLIYVKRPAPDMEPRLADMLARLQDEDTVSYKPFGDAGELHDLLLDDLAVLLTERFDDARGQAPSSPQPRDNLPAETSSFLGREAELRDLRALIGAADVRLVTLTGPGGTGKTRLAIKVVADEVERFADGVFFVDLSAEREADHAFAAVARVVGVTVASEARPVDALVAELRERQILLVLDNFEQAMPAAVGVVELLERCPDVKVLVTSREALRVRGERVFPVPPLSVPDEGDVASAGDSEAVRLFCERAAALQPSFGCNAETAEAITDICRRLDGLPLAIELAAARINLFDVHDLRARLEDRFDVLRGGARDLPQRQQTLRDAIAWSYDLLAEQERQVLRVFAVFSSARLADVEATARRIAELGDVDVVEALGSLVDKSLVRSVPGTEGAPRFSMLQTIRAFADEQLDAMPELAAASRRAHAEHYTEVASTLHQQLTFAARDDVLAALGDELGNLRAAWDEWVARGAVASLNGLLGPLWGYYEARGDYRSAIELGSGLLRCLAETPDSADRRGDEFAVRMNVIRTELAVRGFTAEAERMLSDALDRAELTADARQRFPGLRSLAYLHLMRYDFQRTSTIARELMAIAEEEHDPLLLGEAHLLAGLDIAWRVDLGGSLEHLDKAVGYFESTSSGYVDFRVGPNPWVVAIVVSGLTRWLVGCPDAATSTMQRGLDLAAGLDHPYSMAYALHHAGLLDLWRHDLQGVADRADALLTVAERHDYPTWRALALVFGGLALVGDGEGDAGLARVEEGFELYKGLSAPPVFWPALLMIRARVLGMVGRSHEAVAVIQEAASVLRTGDPLAPDVSITHGDLLLGASPPDVVAAEAAFEQAARLAGERGSRMAQLQALTRLAVLRRGTPREVDALDALRDVYDRFTEGLDSPPLVAAREALDAP